MKCTASSIQTSRAVSLRILSGKLTNSNGAYMPATVSQSRTRMPWRWASHRKPALVPAEKPPATELNTGMVVILWPETAGSSHSFHSEPLVGEKVSSAAHERRDDLRAASRWLRRQRGAEPDVVAGGGAVPPGCVAVGNRRTRRQPRAADCVEQQRERQQRSHRHLLQFPPFSRENPLKCGVFCLCEFKTTRNVAKPWPVVYTGTETSSV